MFFRTNEWSEKEKIWKKRSEMICEIWVKFEMKSEFVKTFDQRDINGV